MSGKLTYDPPPLDLKSPTRFVKSIFERTFFVENASADVLSDVSLKSEEKDVEAEKLKTRDRTALDQKQVTEFKAERKTIVEQVTPKIYTEYERVRKKTKNTPIADATSGRCSACHILLRPQFLQDLRKQDQIMYCESCSRILTYNPVVDVAADASASQQIA